MRAAVLALILCALASVGAAQTEQYPRFVSVTGVASDDVLNVRLHPDASAPIVATLTPDQFDVEAVGETPDGTWVLLNIRDISGWASARYLRKQPVGPDYHYTRQLTCVGTEPFWSLRVTQGLSAEFSGLDLPTLRFPAGNLQQALARYDRFLLGLGDRATAILTQELCTDGMSDRAFGLDISLILQTETTMLMSGCCSIVAD